MYIVRTNAWRDLRLPMSASATVTQYRFFFFFPGKLTAKIDVLIGLSYVTIADADIGSLKSLHTFLNKLYMCTTCW